MKKFICLLFIYIQMSLSLCGVIIETNHFSELNDYMDQDTLVILDIDDTILIPVQTLGTDVWFLYKLKMYQQTKPHPEALDRALAEWEAIRHLTQIKIVEEGTEKMIEDLQNQKIKVMALTTQGLALATRTVKQLESLKIDLTKTAPSKEDYFFINQHGVLYRHGILFTSGTPKGPALLKLLDLMNFHPQKIVFINDKQTHLKDVEDSVITRNISFIGLRYSYSDERVAQFNPQLAEIQWKHSTLGHLLSDEEAQILLENSP